MAAACCPVGASSWLAEHEAKALLRARGVPVVGGRLALNEDEAVAAFRELASPVALKVSSPSMRHKTQAGAIALDVRDEPGVREAFRRLGAVGTRLSCTDNPTAQTTPFNAGVLVETMAPPGAEIFVAVRTDAVVPVLVVGRGGVDVEALDDVAIVPLPADEQRIERALATLKLPVPPGAATIAAQIAAAAGGLALLECNPVLIHSDGAVVVDAIAKEVVT
jgi:acetate---CoA ligase (ADP-forming)